MTRINKVTKTIDDQLFFHIFRSLNAMYCTELFVKIKDAIKKRTIKSKLFDA